MIPRAGFGLAWIYIPKKRGAPTFMADDYFAKKFKIDQNIMGGKGRPTCGGEEVAREIRNQYMRK